MGFMERDWSRLGVAIRDARKATGLGQRELAERARMSRSTVQYLEAGRVPTGRDPHSLPAIERALGWPPGTALAVAEGADAPKSGEGEEIEVRHEPLRDPSLIEKLPLQIRDELARGELLGVDVIDLGPTEAGGRMIVVVKRDGDQPADPEQVRELLKEWNSKQRQLRRDADE